MTTVVATPGQGPDRPQEVSYTDIKVGNNINNNNKAFSWKKTTKPYFSVSGLCSRQVCQWHPYEGT